MKQEEFSMSKLCTSFIEDEIKRSIINIARLCNVSDTLVIETIKKILKI